MQDSFFNHEIEDKVLKALIMQFESLLSLNFWVSRKERGGALPSQTNGNYYNFHEIFMSPDIFQI